MTWSRHLPLLLAVVAVVLLLGFGLGVIERPAWLRGEAESEEPPPVRVEDADEETTPADPTLVGRATDTAVTADGTVLPPPVDLGAVDRERDLHGTVVRANGTPVAGARLLVVTYPWRHQDLLTDGLYEQALDGSHTRSAVDGTLVRRLPRAARVALRVSAAGLAPVEFHQLQAGERLRVVLHTGAALRIVVIGPDGQLVEGTRVRLSSLGGSGRSVEGSTGADGVLVLADLEPKRSVVLYVFPPRHGHAAWDELGAPARGTDRRRRPLRPGGLDGEGRQRHPRPGGGLCTGPPRRRRRGRA